MSGWNNDTTVVYEKKSRQFGPDISHLERANKRTSNSRMVRGQQSDGIEDVNDGGDGDSSSVGSFPDTWKSVASIASFDDRLSMPGRTSADSTFYRNSVGAKGSSNISGLTVSIVENTAIGCEPGESAAITSIVTTPVELSTSMTDVLSSNTDRTNSKLPRESASTVKITAKDDEDDDNSEILAPTTNDNKESAPGLSRKVSALKGSSSLNRTATTNVILIRSDSRSSGGKGSENSVNCKVLNMREGMKLLKSKDNSSSLWTIFHYYARRQNSPEGQNKLRKEIAKSYLYSITAAQQQQTEMTNAFAYLDEDASQSSVSRIGSDPSLVAGDDQSINMSTITGDPEEISPAVLLTVDEKKKLKVIVDKILFASMPTSAAPRGSSVMKLPSPVYNNALSDKCNLLSPVMIVQLVRDFGLLSMNCCRPSTNSNSGSNGGSMSEITAPTQTTADIVRINRIVTEIISKGEESLPPESMSITAANTAANASGGRSAAAAAATGGMSSTFYSDVSMNSNNSGGGSAQLLSLPVLTTYMNFITFQKVRMHKL